MSEDSIEVQICGACGIRFGAPAKWWAEKRETKATFYCPNGHSRAFRESEADKLRQERDRLKQQMAYKEDQVRAANEARQAAERQAAAARGQVTKLKKRAGAGVCPCCNRTFQALARHMAQKHPQFACEATENVVPIRA